MLTRPEKLPRFASEVTAEVTEPSEPKKDIGWIAEKPPHEYFNWLHKIVYDWIAYFEENMAKLEIAMFQLMRPSPIGHYETASYLPAVYGLAYSPTLKIWVAVGYDPTPGFGTMILTSGHTATNDSDWTTQTAPDTDVTLNSVVWADALGMFVALGFKISPAIVYIMTSTDGVTWIRRTAGITVNNGSTKLVWNGVILVSVGSAESITTSVDGINWVEQTPDPTHSLYSICWSPELELFVTCGYLDGVHPLIKTSATGLTWNTIDTSGITLPDGNADPTSVVWHKKFGKFFMVKSNSPTGEVALITSPDGIVFTKQPNPATGAYEIAWDKLCVTDHLLIAVNYSSFGYDGETIFYVTSDGVTWSKQTLKYDGGNDDNNFNFTVEILAHNGSQFMAAGSWHNTSPPDYPMNYIYCSPDV